MQTKDDMKTIALGTSKINYLDPRITVAWCKRHEVPIEKVSYPNYFFNGGTANRYAPFLGLYMNNR